MRSTGCAVQYWGITSKYIKQNDEIAAINPHFAFILVHLQPLLIPALLNANSPRSNQRHPMRYSHFMYNTYPTALIWPRTQALRSFTWSPAVNFISYRGIGSRKCSFPAKCVGIFDDETFTEVRKWCGFSFAWKNRGWDGFSSRKPSLSWLRSTS